MADRGRYQLHHLVSIPVFLDFVDFSTYLEIAPRVVDAKVENIWRFPFHSVDIFSFKEIFFCLLILKVI